jgi:hypothetical protein
MEDMLSYDCRNIGNISGANGLDAENLEILDMDHWIVYQHTDCKQPSHLPKLCK